MVGLKKMSLLQYVETLQNSPSASIQANVAEKVSYFFNCDMYNDSEALLIHEILKLLITDTEKYVKRILVENLKENPKLPKDIALSFASDKSDDIACPILELSQVFNDGDLIELINSLDSITRNKAIARRRHLSQDVTNALIAHKTQEKTVIESLIINLQAQISDDGYGKIIKTYTGEETILKSLVNRANLPNKIAMKLINLVSDNLAEELSLKHNISKKDVTSALESTKKQAINQTVGEGNSTIRARKLYSEKKLTNTIIIQSLCNNDMDFFAVSMSLRVVMPINQITEVILSNNPQKIKSLLTHAKMPFMLTEVITVILEFNNTVRNDNLPRQEYKKRLAAYINKNNLKMVDDVVINYIKKLIEK